MGTQDNMMSVLKGPGRPVPRPPQVQGDVEGVVRSIAPGGVMFTIPGYDGGKFVYGPAKWRGNVSPIIGVKCLVSFAQGGDGHAGLGKPWVVAWDGAATGGMPVLAAAPASPAQGQEYWDSTLDHAQIYSGTQWLPLLTTEEAATSVVGPQAFGSVAEVGVLPGYAREDHAHGLPNLPAVVYPPYAAATDTGTHTIASGGNITVIPGASITLTASGKVSVRCWAQVQYTGTQYQALDVYARLGGNNMTRGGHGFVEHNNTSGSAEAFTVSADGEIDALAAGTYALQVYLAAGGGGTSISVTSLYIEAQQVG